jgi:hypothetical protein
MSGVNRTSRRREVPRRGQPQRPIASAEGNDRLHRALTERGRAADPKLRPPSSTAKGRSGRAMPDQTPPTVAASLSPSIKEVLVGDIPPSISIEIGANKETNDERTI